jgi:hypothetical protein
MTTSEMRAALWIERERVKEIMNRWDFDPEYEIQHAIRDLAALATPSVASPQPWTDKDLEKVCHQICCARSYDHDGEDIKVLRAFLATAAAPVGEPGRTPPYKQPGGANNSIELTEVYSNQKEYMHWPWCNGDRRVPAGEPGHSCCCFNHKAYDALMVAAPPAQGAPTPAVAETGKVSFELLTRERLIQWMVEHSLTTGHGDTCEDLLQELERQIRDFREFFHPTRPRLEEARWWRQRTHKGAICSPKDCEECARIAELGGS